MTTRDPNWMEGHITVLDKLVAEQMEEIERLRESLLKIELCSPTMSAAWNEARKALATKLKP